MSEDWDAVATDVIAAIEEVGFTAKLKRKSTGPTNSWQGSTLNPSSDGDDVKVMLSKTTYAEGQSDQVLVTDRFIIMGASLAPKKDDKIIIVASNKGLGAGQYNIENVTVISPANVDLLYRLQIRK